MLEHFNDWPRVELQLYYDATSYNPATGEVERGYKKGNKIEAFAYQASAMQGAISDKIVDQSDLVVVYEKMVDKESLVNFNGEWYQVISPDDVLFQGEVITFGLKRTEKPEVVSVDE